MNERELQRAGEFIRAQVLTQGGPAEHIGRTRFMTAIEQRKPRLPRRLLAVTVVAIAMAIGFGVASYRQKSRALTYHVGTSAEAGEIGSYVSAPAARQLDLNFSEGSRVVLEPGARGRVARSTSHGATMVLEDGRASVDIVHRPGTDWRILAGPYVVRVAGTSFEVSYNVSTQTFELDMREGVVRVTGPGLAVPGEIRGTQRLLLSPGRGNDSAPVDPAGPPSTIPPASNPSAVTHAEPPARETTRPPVDSRPQATNARTGDSWSQLAARAEHRRILELAENRGVDQVLESASGPDLFALGNAARLSGKHHLASKAYRAIRNRFGTSTEATSAAFFLGRVYEGSDPASAIGWYDQYAQEAPGGAWVAEALGRRMVLLNASKGAEAARTAAEDYLQRFASGPYAGFAQKILQL